MPYPYKRPYRATPFRAPRTATRYSRTVAPIRRAMKFSNKASMLKRTNVRTGGFLGEELKFMDSWVLNTAFAASNDASAGEFDPVLGDCLNSIDEGSGQSQRDGRKALLKSVAIEGHIESDGLSDQDDMQKQAYFYIALVLDTQTNGAQLSSEEVFKNVAGLADQAASPMRSLERFSRFKVLKWLRIKAPIATAFNDAAATGSIAGYQIPFSMYVKLNLPVTYVGTTGGIADISDNSIHVIGWTSIVTMAPKMTYAARVRFIG